MSERVRNALFNTIGNEVKDARVLDVFAGSGSIGLEAVSRGAAHATFIEKDRVATKIIEANIALVGAGEETSLVKAPVASWLDTYKGEPFDLIIADPPYTDLQLSTVFRLMGLLTSNGLMVLSYPGRGEAPTANGVVVVDNRSYGTAALAYYRKKSVL